VAKRLPLHQNVGLKQAVTARMNFCSLLAPTSSVNTCSTVLVCIQI